MRLTVLILTSLILVQGVAGTAVAQAPQARQAARRADPPDGFRTRRLAFEPNRGQLGRQVRWAARGGSYDVYVTGDELVLALPAGNGGAHRLALRMVGGSLAAEPEPIGLLETTTRYYLGGEPNDWITGVPSFERLRLPGVWPGIDVLLYGRDRDLEFDFAVAPGADASLVRLEYDGARGLSVTASGALRIELSDGELTHPAPLCYQERAGRRIAVPGRYVVTGGHRVAFEVAAPDPRAALTIDPVLVYSTYFGGNSQEVVDDVTLDGDGNAYVVGTTWSSDFPTTSGQPVGSNRMFVMKFDPDGGLLWSAFLTAKAGSSAHAVAVDKIGVYVVGETTGNIPTVLAATQPNYGGGPLDGFLVRVPQDPAWPYYGTFIGGGSYDQAYGVDLPSVGVSNLGTAYVTGGTRSGNFPTVAGQMQGGAGSTACFIQRIDFYSPLAFSATFGTDSVAYDIEVVDTGGPYFDVIVVGDASGGNFPFVNAFLSPKAGGFDGFVARVEGSFAKIAWAARLAGSGEDRPRRMLLDAQKNIVVTGWTTSTDFPLQNPIDAVAVASEAFVSKLRSDGQALLASTYLGGSLDDRAHDVAQDAAGDVYVAGTTSGGVPIVDAFQATVFGGADAFVTKLTRDLQGVVYSTLLGGSGADEAKAIAVTPAGSAIVAGTAGADLPVMNPFQAAWKGQLDGFVARLSAESMTAYGQSTRGPSGAVPNLAGGFAPRIGGRVALDVRGGRGAAPGLLLLGAGRTSGPLRNATLLVASPLVYRALVLQGAAGFAPHGFHTELVLLPNVPALVGARLDWQAVFADLGGQLSATNGIEMTIVR